MSNPLLREIIEEPLFKTRREEYKISCQRLDDVLEGITFALSLNPEYFEKVPGTKLRAFKTAVYQQTPSLRVIFYVSEEDQAVHLLTIELCDDVEPVLTYTES